MKEKYKEFKINNCLRIKFFIVLFLVSLLGCKENGNNIKETSQSNGIKNKKNIANSASLDSKLSPIISYNSKSYPVSGTCNSNLREDVLVSMQGSSEEVTTKLPCISNKFEGEMNMNMEMMESISESFSVTFTHGSDTKTFNVEGDINNFVTKWEIPSDNYKFTLPLKTDEKSVLVYNFNIDWGDGTPISEITSFDDVDKFHIYATSGTYTIMIQGTCEGFQNTIEPFNRLLIEVVNLGNVGWKDLSKGFWNNLFLENISGGDTSSVTNMSQMFFNTPKSNPDTSEWDTSNVTNMSFMFSTSSVANPDTSRWNTSKVTDMSGMFELALQANPDTSGWDTSKVTNMEIMFSDAIEANPDTSGWDTSKVTNMQAMFVYSIQANPDMSGWDFTNVKNMNNIIQSSNISTENYSKFLISLDETTPVNPNMRKSIRMTEGYNSSAALARASLEDKGWSIHDGGEK